MIMSGCVCRLSENGSILMHALPILKGPPPQRRSIHDGNIKLKLLIYRYLLSQVNLVYLHIVYFSVLALLHLISYNISRKKHTHIHIIM